MAKYQYTLIQTIEFQIFTMNVSQSHNTTSTFALNVTPMKLKLIVV